MGSLACLEDIARFCSFGNHEVVEEGFSGSWVLRILEGLLLF